MEPEMEVVIMRIMEMEVNTCPALHHLARLMAILHLVDIIRCGEN